MLFLNPGWWSLLSHHASISGVPVEPSRTSDPANLMGLGCGRSVGPGVVCSLLPASRSSRNSRVRIGWLLKMAGVGWGALHFPPLFPPCSQKAACAVACGLSGRLRAGPLPFSLGLWGPSRVPWVGVPGLGWRALEEPLGLNLTLPALCLAALQVWLSDLFSHMRGPSCFPHLRVESQSPRPSCGAPDWSLEQRWEKGRAPAVMRNSRPVKGALCAPQTQSRL